MLCYFSILKMISQEKSKLMYALVNWLFIFFSILQMTQYHLELLSVCSHFILPSQA